MLKLLLLFLHLTFSTEMKVCMEDSHWYPYVFSSPSGSPAGIQVEIVKDALENLKIDYSFEMLPWKRCLAFVKKGTFDAAIAASFNEDRDSYMFYPKKGSNIVSDFRIATAKYVVINLISQDYEFNGDVSLIPTPVFVPMGYSIIKDLKNKGLEVESGGKSDEINFKKLLSRKMGSVVAILPSAQNFIVKNKYQNVLNISSKPIKSKDNFMAFSKETKIPEERRKKIWEEIKKSRMKLYKRLSEKY